MTRLGFLTSLTNFVVFLLVSGSSSGAPHSVWRYEGDHKPFSPFLRDLTDEDIRLYNDVYSLLKDDFVIDKEDLKPKDEPERFYDGFDDYAAGRDFGEQLESAISRQMEAADHGAKRYQTFILGGDDLDNKKKRNNIKHICDKGNSFGNWLVRLCNKMSSSQ